MDIAHVRAFVAVAEELNFRKAAARLFVAASPLSRRIKELEEAVGAQLFERDTRHVQLTSAGMALLPVARGVLEQFDSMTWVVRGPPDPAPLRIGVTVGIHPMVRDVAVARAAISMSVTGVDLVPLAWPQAEHLLVSGELDLAILLAPFDAVEIDWFAARSDDAHSVALPAGDTLADQASVELRELASRRCLFCCDDPPTPLQQQTLDRLHEAGIHEITLKPVSALVTMGHLIATGAGFMIVPGDPAHPIHRTFDRDPEIVLRPVNDLGVSMVTAIAWSRRRADAEPRLAALIERLRVAFLAGHDDGANDVVAPAHAVERVVDLSES
jgi:DNA-binding transcriptional LysR family regulator